MDAEHAAALTWRQLGAFIDVLLDAYVGPDDLDMLLTFQLEKPGALPNNDMLKPSVSRLIRDARSGGWLPDLINAVLEDRPGNAKLKAWVKAVDQIVAQQDPPRAQRLLDTAFFDLGELRKAVARARTTTRGQVLAFGVTYAESVFVRKLSDWLVSYLGETQVKEPLNLKPEFAKVSNRLIHVARYRPELDSANVLCIVNAEGVPAETVAEFWQGVCREFDGVRRYLVLVLTGYQDATFPQGVTMLPPPQFDLSDVDLWTHDMVRGLRDWPMHLADAWTDLLREKSMDGAVLDVRFLYEAMDRTIEDARFNADSFRRQLEERSGYAHATPA